MRSYRVYQETCEIHNFTFLTCTPSICNRVCHYCGITELSPNIPPWYTDESIQQHKGVLNCSGYIDVLPKFTLICGINKQIHYPIFHKPHKKSKDITTKYLPEISMYHYLYQYRKKLCLALLHKDSMFSNLPKDLKKIIATQVYTSNRYTFTRYGCDNMLFSENCNCDITSPNPHLDRNPKCSWANWKYDFTVEILGKYVIIHEKCYAQAANFCYQILSGRYHDNDGRYMECTFQDYLAELVETFD